VSEHTSWLWGHSGRVDYDFLNSSPWSLAKCDSVMEWERFTRMLKHWKEEDLSRSLGGRGRG